MLYSVTLYGTDTAATLAADTYSTWSATKATVNAYADCISETFNAYVIDPFAGIENKVVETVGAFRKDISKYRDTFHIEIEQRPVATFNTFQLKILSILKKKKKYFCITNYESPLHDTDKVINFAVTDYGVEPIGSNHFSIVIGLENTLNR